ncbi:Endonuclease/exonuclease/phosphatase, partial [Blakeslea trispora]
MIQSTINIATLNCRGLPKANDFQRLRLFIRFLRSLNIDILCLQETHATTPALRAQFDMLFNTTSSIWTPHCGIVSLQQSLIVTEHSSITEPEGRFIYAQLFSHIDPTTPILSILNIYAPANHSRKAFYQRVSDNQDLMSDLRDDRLPTFILGDFNFDVSQHSTITNQWLQLLDLHYCDCFMEEPRVTYHSAGRRTRIDFLFCSTRHHHSIKAFSQQFISPTWTDHDLLAVTFQPSAERKGSGLWKGSPFLDRIPAFRTGLTEHVIRSLTDQGLLGVDCTTSAQDIWESTKREAQLFAKSFQNETNKWRTKTLKKFQSKRNRILRDYKHTAILSSTLPQVEKMIASLQQEIAHYDSLQAGKFW